MKKYNWMGQSAHGAIVLSASKPRVVSQIGSWVYDTYDSLIVGINRSNLNWKESLIDLSKNDYIIKDGILMATRKHAALIHAWADGAEIQAKNKDGWVDIHGTPAWFPDSEYRIKPKTKTVKFRNYIANGKAYVVQEGETLVGHSKIDWLSPDLQEVEIEQ